MCAGVEKVVEVCIVQLLKALGGRTVGVCTRIGELACTFPKFSFTRSFHVKMDDVKLEGPIRRRWFAYSRAPVITRTNTYRYFPTLENVSERVKPPLFCFFFLFPPCK